MPRSVLFQKSVISGKRGERGLRGEAEELGDRHSDVTTDFLRQPQRDECFQRDTGCGKEREERGGGRATK